MLLENLTGPPLVKTHPNLTEPQYPLPCSHRTVPSAISISHSILYDSLYYYLLSMHWWSQVSLYWGFQTKRLGEFLSCAIHVISSVHFFLHDLTNLSKWKILFWLPWKAVYSALILLSLPVVRIFSPKLRSQTAALINVIANRWSTRCGCL
jgi:hypothetical protein